MDNTNQLHASVLHSVSDWLKELRVMYDLTVFLNLVDEIAAGISVSMTKHQIHTAVRETMGAWFKRQKIEDVLFIPVDDWYELNQKIARNIVTTLTTDICDRALSRRAQVLRDRSLRNAN